ncbi:MAG: hypothetical protein IPF40_08260 [Actinomycetales bacterium]|jgi:fatty acid desaturase|uniref:Uncharacterized protein n=1 Tax=Candidatus Phosphoribacter hodrii TaxID=2953743 RepID=A0A934X588_9MICO|nr:hypothetical protein [Candidatus Phosphoribacter hodrii]
MSQPPHQIIPAPRGPNSRLLIHSLLLLLGAAALLGHLAGIEFVTSVSLPWPMVLIIGGAALVVIGQLGLLRRRHRS